MAIRHPPSPSTSALVSKLVREHEPAAPRTPQLTQPFLLVSFPRQGTDWLMGACFVSNPDPTSVCPPPGQPRCKPVGVSRRLRHGVVAECMQLGESYYREFFNPLCTPPRCDLALTRPADSLVLLWPN